MMSYQPYANPATGYRKSRPSGYSSPAKRATAKGKEGTFVELPVTGGVGLFHINHFVGYSSQTALTPKVKSRLAELQQRFRDDFTEIFSVKNVAEANLRPHLHRGNDTIEFEIGGNDESSKSMYYLRQVMGFNHSDWVSMQDHPESGSFYAMTLKRDWATFLEESAISALERMDESAVKAAEAFFEINRHHFLAGRRSFKVGYDEHLQRCYIETAALERSSLDFYDLIERTGLLRPMIVQIWTSLIENFEKECDGGPEFCWLSASGNPENVPDDYKVKGNVAYRTAQVRGTKEVVGAPWFKKVLTRHPGLVAGLKIYP